jgi:hypothetical protein
MALAFDGGAYPQPSRMMRTSGFGLGMSPFHHGDTEATWIAETHHAASPDREQAQFFS